MKIFKRLVFLQFILIAVTLALMVKTVARNNGDIENGHSDSNTGKSPSKAAQPVATGVIAKEPAASTDEETRRNRIEDYNVQRRIAEASEKAAYETHVLRWIGIWALVAEIALLLFQNLYTAKAAKAATDSVELIIKKERATIRIEPGEIIFSNPDAAFPLRTVSYSIFCDGTTNAYIRMATATATVTDSKEPPDWGTTPMGIPSVVRPSIDGVQISAWLDGLDPNWAAIDERSQFVHFCGMVFYRDVFERDERKVIFRVYWKLNEGVFYSNGHRIGYWAKCGTETDNQNT